MNLIPNYLSALATSEEFRNGIQFSCDQFRI